MAKLLERALEIFFILALLYLVTGCHTVGGFGRDLQDWSSPYTQRDE